MDVLIWMLMAAPAVFLFVLSHWQTHVHIGRRLAALYLWSAAWTPKLVRSLGRAARENARVVRA